MYYLGGHFNIQTTMIMNLLQALLRYMHTEPPDRHAFCLKLTQVFAVFIRFVVSVTRLWSVSSSSL
jgi:hypothetical protein